MRDVRNKQFHYLSAVYFSANLATLQ